MRLRKRVEELEGLLTEGFNSLERGLKIVVARGEVVEILKTEIELLREERKELLDRLMARDFETLQTYTAGGNEKEMEEVKPEENEEMAGEIFAVAD